MNHAKMDLLPPIVTVGFARYL